MHYLCRRRLHSIVYYLSPGYLSLWGCISINTCLHACIKSSSTAHVQKYWRQVPANPALQDPDSWELALMSLFEKYAYRRKEKAPVYNSNEAQDGLTHWNGSVTLNRAHQPAVTRVSETPESLLPKKASLEGDVSPRSSRIGRCKGRQRRRARILSSSSEGEGPDTPPLASILTPVKISSLFSKLPQSKRRKVDLPKEVKRCKVDLPEAVKRSAEVTPVRILEGTKGGDACYVTPYCVYRRVSSWRRRSKAGGLL